ncbi:MAG TPA: 3-oxo-tetronate kinase [Azospirillaceae bacterium]|nr:3-oxo-tetronate kinase [Azospirillaceae bacterium]
MALMMGAIADDLTGATDLANAINGQGLSCLIRVGVPEGAAMSDADAVIVALKSRTCLVEEAVDQSLRAFDWLRRAGAGRILFKYCSTFDSTPKGNIGPVSEALLDRAGQTLMVHCPAFPDTGRTVVDGRLLVNGVPLSQTPMRDHPLTPMRRSFLPAVLRAQTQGGVGRLPLATLRQGARIAARSLDRQRRRHVRHVIADAENWEDLALLAAADHERLLAGGASGLGQAVAALLAHGRAVAAPALATVPPGPALVLAGSCSARTLEQLAVAEARQPVLRLDVGDAAREPALIERAVAWIAANLSPGAPPVVATSAAADERGARQRQHPGIDLAAAAERTLAAIARRATASLGVSRLLVAGGETSGAVIEALGVTAMRVLRPVDPGVPMMVSAEGPPLALILKSGNFGRPTLFADGFGHDHD